MEEDSLETFAEEKGIAFFLVSPQIYFPSLVLSDEVCGMHVCCWMLLQFLIAYWMLGCEEEFVDDGGPFGF